MSTAKKKKSSEEKLSAGEVYVYSNGFVHCSVCAPKKMTKVEIVKQVNARNNTGISSDWTISKEKTFKSGQPNPCQCDSDDERVHYLMVC